MNLSVADITYINSRLDEHKLKYQEVYDEIKDHVLLAIESAHTGGDECDIEYVYNDMMAAQFPGYYAFEKIAIEYEKAYRTKIKKIVWANVRYYLKPLNVLLLALAIFAGYYLPENKATYIVMLAVLLIVSVAPIIYARIKSAKIKTDTGKQSIVREHIGKNAALIFVNFYLVIIGIDFFIHDGWSATFEAGTRQPTINLFIIAFAVIYGLSIARLCRQEIKIPALTSTIIK